jgi:hypothetical protein
MLREAPVDGKKGPVSMRRVGAALLIPSGISTIILGVILDRSGPVIGISGGIQIGAGILLLLFTTWTDIKGIVSAYTGSA